MLTFRMLFQTCICGTAAPQNRVASSEEAEDFLSRVLGLYTHKFPKHCAVLLTDLLEHLFFFLPELRL